MSVELNDPCPCGSTKKVKFCCGKAVSADLEKVAKSLEGEQFMAASERQGNLSTGVIPPRTGRTRK